MEETKKKRAMEDVPSLWGEQGSPKQAHLFMN
jgi:hypothetical protein